MRVSWTPAMRDFGLRARDVRARTESFTCDHGDGEVNVRQKHERAASEAVRVKSTEI